MLQFAMYLTELVLYLVLQFSTSLPIGVEHMLRQLFDTVCTELCKIPMG